MLVAVLLGLAVACLLAVHGEKMIEGGFAFLLDLRFEGERMLHSVGFYVDNEANLPSNFR